MTTNGAWGGGGGVGTMTLSWGGFEICPERGSINACPEGVVCLSLGWGGGGGGVVGNMSWGDGCINACLRGVSRYNISLSRGDVTK